MIKVKNGHMIQGLSQTMLIVLWHVLVLLFDSDAENPNTIQVNCVCFYFLSP